jgi:hypothetical protein
MERINKNISLLLAQSRSPCPLLINIGIASTCHTEGGKTIRDERRAAITAVSADVGGVASSNDSKKGGHP